jgi:hypothetical protein
MSEETLLARGGRQFNIIPKLPPRLFDSFQTLCNDDSRMTRAHSSKEGVAKPPV